MEEQEMQQEVEQPQEVQETTGGVTTEQEATGDVITEQDVQESPQLNEDFYKNRYAEAQRKLENRDKQLEDVLQKVDQKLTAQPEQQKYTMQELENFQENTDNDSHRIWAKNEIQKLQKEESVKLVRSELQSFQMKQQVESTKQNTFRDVVSRNPDLVITDGAGNFVGWNEKSTMLQGMQKYLRDPRVGNQPDALAIAEKFALADQYMTSKPRVQNKIVEQKEQIKNLQRKTLMEGGGREGNYTPSASDAAMSDLDKSGSVADAAKVIGLRRK